MTAARTAPNGEPGRLVNLTLALASSNTAPSADRDRGELASHGLTLREGEPNDRDLAWIDAEFNGFWSSEARGGFAFVASDPNGPVGFVSVDRRQLRWPWLSENGAAIFGPIGVASSFRGRGVGTALARLGLGELRRRGFERATIGGIHDGPLVAWFERVAMTPLFASQVHLEQRRRRVTVLASGGGTNFQAVVDAARTGVLEVDPATLIVNRSDAYAVERARRAGIAAQIVQWDRATETRAAYDDRLLAAVAATQPELVLLLGWMHVLAPAFIARFPSIVNIHPAYLPFDAAADTVVTPDGTLIPAFRGAHAIRDALVAGSRWYGATAHRVGVDVDRGDVLARRPLPLKQGSQEAALAELRSTEHGVLISAIQRWTYEGYTAPL